MDQHPNRYIGYVALPVRRNPSQGLYGTVQNALQKRIDDFMANHPEGVLEKIFVESDNNQRHRHLWPELSSAVSLCLSLKAHLVISEIRNLTRNEAFAAQILRLTNTASSFRCELHCCDQPCINNENLALLIEHAQEQRKIHGQLIKAGLSRTTAKSGNPHATEVIAKVNKPKIDNAIQFALLLQPIIAEYRHLGYSQRKMVNALNEEGFTAPEGGKWVLSQLQKVLERIKMNESALTLETKFLEHQAKKDHWAVISDALNKQAIVPPKGNVWTEEIVIAVDKRIQKIREITQLNQFVIELSPILNKYPLNELTEAVLASELQNAGFPIPQQPATHAIYSTHGGSPDVSQ